MILVQPAYELVAGPYIKPATRAQMEAMVQAVKEGRPLPPPFDGTNPHVKRIQQHGGTWQALDTLYNLPPEREFWLNILNIQAIRNRKVMVQDLLERIIGDSSAGQVRILELASGSAQPLIQAIANLQAHKEIKAVLVDTDETALEHARKLACIHNVAQCIGARKGNVFFAGPVAEEFKPTIIEMVGLADYLRDSALSSLLRKVNRWLPAGGTLIMGNVTTENPEQEFIEQVYRWPSMVYRTEDEFQGLVLEAGFTDCEIHKEPHNIHMIVVARK